jgi:hypothetical protein
MPKRWPPEPARGAAQIQGKHESSRSYISTAIGALETRLVDTGHPLKSLQCLRWVNQPNQEMTMKLLTDLISTDYGLMSLAVIIVTLGMAVWFRMFFVRKMNEEAANTKS